jgi:hypothetical protein
VPVLKNADVAIIDARKFLRYCLDPHSRHGRHKARLFEVVLGFDLSNYLGLIASIREGISRTPAEYQGETAHGHRWRVDLLITGPGGRATVRTAWIYEKGNDVPRLTTAYVLGNKR